MNTYSKNIVRSGLLLCLALSLLAGCATTPPSSFPSPEPQDLWFCTPPKHELDDEFIHVEVIPRCSYWGCTGFDFTLKNKSGSELKILWDKTYYMKNGRQAGGFTFEGIVYKDRLKKQAPEILYGNRKLTRTLFPSDLVLFDKRWRHLPMEAGDNGVAFSISTSVGTEINEQLSMNLSLESVTPGGLRTPCKDYTRPAATKHDWTGISVMNTHVGVGVVNVLLSSPATYKIRPGDIIREINSRPVDNKYVYLQTTLRLKNSKSPVVFLIERDGKELSVTVRESL